MKLAPITIQMTNNAARTIRKYIEDIAEAENIDRYEVLGSRIEVDQLVINEAETMILFLRDVNKTYIIRGEAVAAAYREDFPMAGVERDFYRKEIALRIADENLEGIDFIRRVG